MTNPLFKSAGGNGKDKEHHPGQVLRYEREKKHLAATDIARDLRLSVDIIHNLEDGNFAELPPPIYVRGYIHSYCQLLGVDPQPLIAELELPSPHESLDENEVPDSESEDVYQLTRLWGSLVVLFITVILVSFWWFEHDRQSKLDASGDPSGFATQSRSSTDESLEAQDIDDTEASRESTQMPATIDSTSTMTSGGGAAAVSDLNGIESSATEPSTEREAAADSLPVKVTIRLTTESSWMNVVDGRGMVLVHGLFPRGYESMVEGVLPLQFRLGDARGIRVWVNDSEYDLKQHTSSQNTAFFILDKLPSS